MSKKLIMSCMALVAFAAFVLPASASAANKPTLKDGNGVVAVGSLINGTAANTKFWNTNTTIEQVVCSNAKMTGTVVKNGNDTVEGEITKAEYSGTGALSADNNLNECTGSFGSSYITVKTLPLCIRSTAANAEDEFEVFAKGGAASCEVANGKVKFLIGSTTAGECEYEAGASIKGDFTTGGTQASLTTRDSAAGSGSSLIRGGFLCPTSGVLAMTFTLETDATGNEPIWIEKTP